MSEETGAAGADELSAAEKALVERIGRDDERWLALLESLVGLSSFTADKAGVDAMSDRLDDELAALGFRCSAVVTGTSGRSLLARHPAEDSHRLLLLGHLDTVHPKDAGFEGLRPDGEEPDRLLGPGAADMKGGLVVMLRALFGLRESGLLEGRHVTIILCGDEETGSPTSGDIVRAEAADAQLCLGFEPGRLADDGATTFVTARKGMGRLTIEARGRAAHAGVEPGAGASALRELAAKIEPLEALSDGASGRVVSVGRFSGGVAANVVPDFASMDVDFRFEDEDDGEALQDEITHLAGEHVLKSESGRPLVGKTVRDALRRPPLLRDEASARMAGRLEAWGSLLGLRVREEKRGGSSDAALAAAMGCPAVCGLGAVGGGFHTKREWVSRASLRDRAALAALTMHRFFLL